MAAKRLRTPALKDTCFPRFVMGTSWSPHKGIGAH